MKRTLSRDAGFFLSVLLVFAPAVFGQNPATDAPSTAAAAKETRAPAAGDEQPKARRRPAEPIPAPTLVNIAYGPHPRQVFDLWPAKATKPTPLVLYIHGGGFTGGSKTDFNPQQARDLKELLASGISVASIEYRVIGDAKLPAAHQDVGRATQTLRARAKEWNFDKSRVGAFGGSAGAQLCMYLAFHDDLANPRSSDPVARESSRLACVATMGGQVTRDMQWWVQHVPGYDSPHLTDEGVFGITDRREVLKISADISALSLISADDPPIYMSYAMAPGQGYPDDPQITRAWKVHHVVHGVALKQRCDDLGVEATLKYPGVETRYSSAAAFFKTKLRSQ
jgi:acetyl esterase